MPRCGQARTVPAHNRRPPIHFKKLGATTPTDVGTPRLGPLTFIDFLERSKGAVILLCGIIAPMGMPKRFFYTECRQCNRHLSPGQVRTHATRCRSCEKKGPSPLPKLERPITTHCIRCSKRLPPAYQRKRDRCCRACRHGHGIWRACALCDWNGLCHKHRIVPGRLGGRYTKDNVQRLCPNCHAAQHGQGQLNWPQPSV